MLLAIDGGLGRRGEALSAQSLPSVLHLPLDVSRQSVSSPVRLLRQNAGAGTSCICVTRAARGERDP